MSTSCRRWKSKRLGWLTISKIRFHFIRTWPRYRFGQCTSLHENCKSCQVRIRFCLPCLTNLSRLIECCTSHRILLITHEWHLCAQCEHAKWEKWVVWIFREMQFNIFPGQTIFIEIGKLREREREKHTRSRSQTSDIFTWTSFLPRFFRRVQGTKRTNQEQRLYTQRRVKTRLSIVTVVWMCVNGVLVWILSSRSVVYNRCSWFVLFVPCTRLKKRGRKLVHVNMSFRLRPAAHVFFPGQLVLP